MSIRLPARILIIGSGGREHALAWKLAGEPGVREVIVAPGSAGIAVAGIARVAGDIDPLDATMVVALASSAKVDLVVIGPEGPLAVGVADALRAAGIATFGPGAGAARIETSKSYCHEVAAAAGVRMARAGAFSDHDRALDFARQLAAAGGGGVVVKADGLAAGKGVTVCDSFKAAETALAAIFAGSPAATSAAPDRVVIEERLYGREASLIALSDGRDALALPPARDHKRLLDGDRGPNTGGMGAYSPVPDLPANAAEALVETIHRPLLAELARRGTPFRGALYAGLILTADGPVLLECNARFGDPEMQVLLPRLAVDLGPLLMAAAGGDLAAAARGLGIFGLIVPARLEAAVGLVLAAEGYPEAPRRGDPITGLGFAEAAGVLVFHGGTVALPDGRFATAGGRILTVVGLGADLAAARDAAERAADRIAFFGVQRRHDIAADPPAPLASTAPTAGTAPAGSTTPPASAGVAR